MKSKCDFGPQLTYASVVWWTAFQRNISIKALDKVYRLAMLGMKRAMKPTLSMEAVLNIRNASSYAESSAM